VHLYKIFSARRYIALTAIMSNFVQVVQKWLGMNKFVRTKSHTGSKFSKTTLGYYAPECIIAPNSPSCAPIFQFFLMRCYMAPQQTAKFRTAFLLDFFTSLRKDSVAKYASIWTLFSSSVRELEVLCTTVNKLLTLLSLLYLINCVLSVSNKEYDDDDDDATH